MTLYALLISLLITPPPADAQASQRTAHQAAIAEFQARAQAFARLHERLAREAGALDETKSQAEIAQRAARLGDALRAARANAQPGDIFTPAASRVLRDVIRREYRSRPPGVKESRQDAQEEVPDFVPTVNARYPTAFPLGTFPASLLKVLPALPPPLEYRIVTHYLILRDVEANLIIDVLPNAIRQEPTP